MRMLRPALDKSLVTPCLVFRPGYFKVLPGVVGEEADDTERDQGGGVPPKMRINGAIRLTLRTISFCSFASLEEALLRKSWSSSWWVI